MTDEPFNASDHLSDLRGGKAYLEVKWRLVWLRTEQPDAFIKTELISHTPEEAVFSATVTIPSGGSATGWGSETPGDFGDYLEKAETKALGRALAALGFGTQFCDDYDEGGSVTDSPVERCSANGSGEKAMEAKFDGECSDCGYKIEKGSPILYTGETKMARHKECPVQAPLPQSDPSASRQVDESSQITQQQIRGIRGALHQMFGGDEQKAYEWLKGVEPRACAASKTDYHLGELTMAEATAILAASNKARKPQAATQPETPA